MGSYVKVDSISIDFSQYNDMTDTSKREHFSIRGYVSEIRKKDWKLCWPFPINESDEQPSLPPLDVPKFRRWHCQNCQQETTVEGLHKNDKIDLNYSSCNNAVVNFEIPKAPMANWILARRDIDLNKTIDLSNDSDCMPIDETENNDREIDLENNCKRQVSSAPSPEICPGLIQEVHTNKRDCEGNQVSNVEIDASNINYMDRSSPKVENKGKPISADNQCRKELRKSSTILREDAIIAEDDNVIGDANEHFPLESESESDNFSADYSSKKPQKKCLLAEVMRETDEPETEQITIQKSALTCYSKAPVVSQILSTIHDKVVVQGGMTLAKRDQGRKRKLLLDEKRKPADMCLQRVANEVLNTERDAKAFENFPNNRSKYVHVQDNTKGHRHELERSHARIKKNKKIQLIDHHLFSGPHQGQQRNMEGTTEVSNNDYASKALFFGFNPCASTEKGIGNYPLHAQRIENEYNFSIGKSKILQTDEQLNSSSCLKTNKLVEDSSVLPRAKNMSIMPISILISSTQAAPNGEELKEGRLPLNYSSSTHVLSNKSSHQAENQQPFPWPFQEGTSKAQLQEKGSETIIVGEHNIPSKKINNVIPRDGKGVYIRETNERYCDQIKEKESDEDTIDETTLEVAEILANNQYKRSLLDVENASSLLENSTHRETREKNKMATKGGNMLPRNGFSIKHYFSFDGNQFGMSNPCTTQSSFAFGVSQSKTKPLSGVQFSSIDTSQLGPTQTSKFNGVVAVCRSSDATLQVKEGSNLGKTILQHNNEASNVQASMSTNNAFLRNDEVAKMDVSQPTRGTEHNISLRSSPLHKHNKERDIDLNLPNFIDLEKADTDNGVATFDKKNVEHSSSCKHYGMEPQQNHGRSLDLNSNEIIPAMNLLRLNHASKQLAKSLNAGVSAQMLKKTFNPGECNAKLENSPKRQSSDYCRKSEMMDSSNSFTQNMPIKQFYRPQLEIETPLQHNFDVRGTQEILRPCRSISGNFCMINKNPADFTDLELGNPYMINVEYLKFENHDPRKRHALPTPCGSKQKRNSKGQHKRP